jgi:2-polyprenyl-3-methyl-5-hydroxy-6-metoxy-1,4-benzoquinol methylase
LARSPESFDLGARPCEPGRISVACDLCGSRDAAYLFTKDHDTYVRCRACRLIYLDPQPSNAELEAIYGADYYKPWGISEDAAGVERLKKRTFRSLFRRLEARTGIREGPLLEVGCATGFLLEEARARGFDPYGVELSEYSARLAREKLGADRIHQGTLDGNPFQGRSFSAVVMSDVLEHVGSPSALLGRARALLADAGALVIVAPNVAALSRRILGKHWTDFKREHLFYFEPATLGAMLTRTGFEVLEARPFPKYLDLAYVHRQLSTYQTPFFSSLVRCLHAAAPSALRRTSVPVFAGSMLVIARKARATEWTGTSSAF